MGKTSAHQKYKLKDGTIVPGATTVINSQLGWNKNTLMAWARKEAMAGRDPTKVRDKAAEIGTIAHYLIECHIKNEQPDLDEYSKDDIGKAENAFIAFLDYEKQNKLVYDGSEVQYVSEENRFGGTIDLIARRESGLVLIDFKTSNGVYAEHYVQVAAYYNLALENKKELAGATILQIGKEDGGFSTHALSQSKISWGWDVFKNCLNLYRLQNGAE